MPPPTHDVYSTEQWSRIKLQYTIFIDADHGPGAEIEAGTSPGWCVSMSALGKHFGGRTLRFAAQPKPRCHCRDKRARWRMDLH